MSIITTAQIRARTDQHDDPDHPDANTVEAVEETFAEVQRELATGIDQHDEYHRIVGEDTGVIVYAMSSTADLDHVLDYCEVRDEAMRDIVDGLMHDVARDHSPYEWGADWPLVVEKPHSVREGEAHVERRIAQIASAGCSEAAAMDYWMVEIKGWSQSRWARAVGKTQQTVSANVRKATEALGL